MQQLPCSRRVDPEHRELLRIAGGKREQSSRRNVQHAAPAAATEGDQDPVPRHDVRDLLAYVEHYRATIKGQVTDCLAGRLGLDPDDLRLYVLAELAVAAWSIAGRHWVRNGGRGGRQALVKRFDDAIDAIPGSLHLAEGA